MKALSLFVGIALVASPLYGEETYLPEGAVDVLAVAGEPPVEGSPEQARDLAVVEWETRTRTVEDILIARHVADWDLFVFSEWIGVPACQGASPTLLSVFPAISEECEGHAKIVKDKFKRPRPFLAKTAQPIVICVPAPKPGDYSFPSGHSTRGALWGVLLGDIFPDVADELRNAGLQVGYHRVIGGVHYPTDVEAGQRLGLAFAEAIRPNPKWQSTVETIKAELANSESKLVEAATIP